MSLLCEVLLLSMTLMEDTIFVLFFFFFCSIYLYVVYPIIQIKKIINFSYKDLVSRCVYLHIKVDNFVYI